MPDVTYQILIETQNGSADVERSAGASSSGHGRTPVSSGINAKTYGLLEVGQHIGKTLLNYGKNSIEMYTGNSVLQARVNSGFEVLGSAAVIAANPVLGVTMLAANLGLQATTRAWEIKWENKAAAEQQRRSGNFLTGGGRK